MEKVRGLLSKRDVKIKDSLTRDFVWQQLSYRANLKSTIWVCVGYFKLQQFWWVVLSFFFVQEVGRKPLRTFALGYQKQQNGPEYFPLWVIYVFTSWYIATCFHLRNRQTHDHETNQFFYLTTGDCLITVATGPLSDSDADRAGLVSTHAYALLDMRKIQVSRDS